MGGWMDGWGGVLHRGKELKQLKLVRDCWHSLAEKDAERRLCPMIRRGVSLRQGDLIFLLKSELD